MSECTLNVNSSPGTFFDFKRDKRFVINPISPASTVKTNISLVMKQVDDFLYNRIISRYIAMEILV